MQSIVIKNKYKVIQVLHTEEWFAAFLTVDIDSREKKEYLVNVYEGELTKQYIGCFNSLRHCPEFIEMFAGEGMLAAVFTYREGIHIDSMFFKGAEVDWQVRIKYAQLLFHLGLAVCAFPPEIGCTALLSRNLALQPGDETLGVNYITQPMEGLNARELTLLVSDQVKKVLLRRFASPSAELALLETLDAGVFENAKELYAYWIRSKDALIAEYEKIYGKTAIARGLYLLFLNMGRWFKRVFGKKE